MEKEAGGGIGMGNTCKSMADSYQCMAETTTILWGNWPPANEDKWGKKFMKVPMNIEKTKQKWGIGLHVTLIRVLWDAQRLRVTSGEGHTAAQPYRSTRGQQQGHPSWRRRFVQSLGAWNRMVRGRRVSGRR